jgi:exodeoxyribonuclease-5
MEWTPQQEQALRKAAAWYRAYTKSPQNTPQIFRLFGFAGTGKTTVAKELDQVLTGGQTSWMTPTAKSASVLRSKGVENADTAHAKIYTPKEKSKQRLRDLEAYKTKAVADINRIKSDPWTVEAGRKVDMLEEALRKLEAQIKEEQTKLNRPAWAVNPDAPIKDAPLFGLDEASMFGKTIGEDMLSYGRPILVLGDPAQLPPVGEAGFFTKDEPDVMLTDIRRQALDNPIIKMATTVREGGSLQPGRYGESIVIPRSALGPQHVLEADQLLVGRNATRRSSNLRVRTLLGHQSAFPERGERVVCLRNDRDLGIYNGVTYVCNQDSVDNGDSVTLWLREEGSTVGQEIVVVAHRAHFLGEELPWYEKKDFQEFDYGNALTVHKSQGSQWGRTTLFDEWFMRDSRQQWLYTGLTRAEHQTTVVQF